MLGLLIKKYNESSGWVQFNNQNKNSIENNQKIEVTTSQNKSADQEIGEIEKIPESPSSIDILVSVDSEKVAEALSVIHACVSDQHAPDITTYFIANKALKSLNSRDHRGQFVLRFNKPANHPMTTDKLNWLINDIFKIDVVDEREELQNLTDQLNNLSNPEMLDDEENQLVLVTHLNKIVKFYFDQSYIDIFKKRYIELQDEENEESSNLKLIGFLNNMAEELTSASIPPHASINEQTEYDREANYFVLPIKSKSHALYFAYHKKNNNEILQHFFQEFSNELANIQKFCNSLTNNIELQNHLIDCLDEHHTMMAGLHDELKTKVYSHYEASESLFSDNEKKIHYNNRVLKSDVAKVIIEAVILLKNLKYDFGDAVNIDQIVEYSNQNMAAMQRFEHRCSPLFNLSRWAKILNRLKITIFTVAAIGVGGVLGSLIAFGASIFIDSTTSISELATAISELTMDALYSSKAALAGAITGGLLNGTLGLFGSSVFFTRKKPTQFVETGNRLHLAVMQNELGKLTQPEPQQNKANEALAIDVMELKELVDSDKSSTKSHRESHILRVTFG